MDDELKSGARHSTRDQKLIQEIHDRAVELGAVLPSVQADPVAGYMPVKSENIEKTVNQVREAFYAQYGNQHAPEPAADWWVVDVWDDAAIIHADGGNYYRAPYTRADDKVMFASRDKWVEVEERREWVDVVKALQAGAAADTVVIFGGEVKALGDGRIAGYLVRFSSEDDPDLVGDYFTKDTDFGEPGKLPLLYHHGLDTKVGKRRIGTASVTPDDVGLWLEGQINMHDEYEKAIYQMVQKKKQGLSSGAASHAVTRERGRKASRITQWYIGEASITPTPAEPRNEVMSLKALPHFEIELPEAEPEGSDPGDAAITAETKTNDSAASAAEVNEMTPEEKQELLGEMKTIAVEAAKQGAEAAIAALKTEPPNTPAGGLKTAPGNGQHKTPLGDDPFKAFGWYLKTGDPSGIRTGEAFEQMQRDRHTDELKTTYTLLESTQYQGAEAVPTEVVAKIVERRDPVSVARRAGSDVIQVGSNAFVLPIEKNSPENFVITTIDASNTFDQTTQQPMDKLAGTIYLFTKSVPIDMNLLDDSVFGIEQWWTRRMGRAWGLTENTYFLMGTGSSQPQGAVYASTLGVTAASGTAVTAAEIVEQYHKVPAEYRDRISWVMRGATEGAIRKLTVSTQFPFVGNGGANGGAGMSGLAQGQGWLVSPSAGVFNSDGMDALTTSKKPIFCGNFEAGYVIAERKGLTIFRDPYSLSTKGLVNILAHFRETGGVTNAAALYHLLTPSA